MKTETKTRIWAEVVTQLNKGLVGGKSFKLRFDRQNRPYIQPFCGHHWTLPDNVIEQLTGKAHAAIEAARARAQAESERLAAEYKAAREALDARLDEPGFTLFAGENTDVLCRGTLRECRESRYKVHTCPRDYYTGLGCWIIADSNGVVDKHHTLLLVEGMQHAIRENVNFEFC